MLFLIRWRIAVDFLVLTAAFYALLRWAVSARALRIALSVVVLMPWRSSLSASIS